MLTAVSSPDPTQYDSFAAEFEDHAAEAAYNTLYDRPATLRLAGPVDGLRVLDAGCGPGLYAEELVARGARVTGCDASPQMIALARRRVGDRADLRVQSLDDPMPWLDDGTIDLALCALAYHYVNERPTFLREMRRVLAPDGALVVSTHHPTSDWVRLGGSYFDVRPITETWRRGWTITAWRMPLTRLAGEFADAGFVIERLVEPAPDPKMAETHPDTFEKLSTEPCFIAFRLRKHPG